MGIAGMAIRAKINCTKRVRDLVKDIDIADLKPFNIYYRINHDHPLAWIRADETLKVDHLAHTHQLILSVLAKDVEQAWYIMQGEIWSPEGEARDLIRFFNLNHTSMSVGDVAHDQESDTYWQCDGSGWKEVPK